ncbi:hypothetical protein [Bradyrhizobium sp.]
MPKILGDGDPFPKSVMFGDGDHFPARHGDEDPFPLHHKALAAGGTEEWVLGKASYMAEQLGPFVILHANGTINNTNTTPHLVTSIPIDPKSLPYFVLYFQVQGPGNTVMQPFAVDAHFLSKKDIPTVTVFDADGRHEIQVINWLPTP